MGKILSQLPKVGKVFWETFELAAVINTGKDILKKKAESVLAVEKQRPRLFAAIQANKQNDYSQDNVLQYLERAADRQNAPDKRKHPDKPRFPFTENNLVGLIGGITDDQTKLEEVLRLLDKMPEEEFILMMNILDHDVITQLIKVYGRQLVDKIKMAKDEVIGKIGIIYVTADPIRKIESLLEETGDGIRQFRRETTVPLAQAARSRADNTLRQRIKRVGICKALRGRGRI